MSVSNTIDAFTVTPSSLIVHDTAVYTISIDHAISAHAINDYALITFPSLISVPAIPSCSPSSGTITCSQQSSQILKVVYTSTPGNIVQLTLQDIANYDLANFDVSFSVNVYDGEDYLMEQYAEYNVSFTEAQISSITVNNDDNIALGEVSNVTLTITNGFSINAAFDSTLTQVDVTIPP